jgi:hypothetical protein
VEGRGQDGTQHWRRLLHDFIGFWSGGMIAVMIGKVVEGVRRAPSCEGLPLCNWNVYAAGGAVIGAISLPVLVLMRLRRRDVRQGTRSRG